MAEVMICGVLRVKEGREQEAEEGIRKFMGASHDEPGCIKYAFHKVSGDPTRWVFFEKWADQDAVNAHLKAPHMQGLGAFFSDLLAEPAQFWQVEPLDEGDPAKRL